VDKLQEVVPKDLQNELVENLSQGNFTLRSMYDQFQCSLRIPLNQVRISSSIVVCTMW